MNATQQTLLDQLIALDMDEPGTELTFARRLARENGWSLDYADRVVVEYKRFVFLAKTAGHVVSPSDEVDQAWHLHLTYTRSYWDDLCRDVLREPLHHGPTKGGQAEQAMFVDLYGRTLASYERLLSQKPPADIWPTAAQRFGEDLRHVRVNRERCWIVPKPRWPKWSAQARYQAPLLALGLIGVPLIGVGWNPLDWRGEAFLAFYLILVVIAVVLAWIVRAWPESVDEAVNVDQRAPLNPYEAACLAAGPLQAINAAIASMVQAGNLVLARESGRFLGIFSYTSSAIQRGAKLEPAAPAIEWAIYESAATPVPDMKPMIAAALPVAKRINERLVKSGLLRSGWPTERSLAAGLIVAAPLVVGGLKILVGLSRGRPVGYLFILCVVTAIAALIFAFAQSRLTSSGRALLETLHREHANSKLLAENSPKSLAPAELAMAVGLFGAGMLAVGPLSELHAKLPRSSANSTSYSGGGCGSACGGGCGGGGCGGGCGGCGGCGG